MSSLSPGWIFERIEDWAGRSPDQFAFAVDHQERIEEYGYADVLQHSAAITSELAARGIRHGDHVGILMENIPQWVFVLLGAMRLGAVTVPLATTLPENSIRLIAEHAGCRLIFTDGHNLEKASCAGKQLGCDVVDATGSAIRHQQLAVSNSAVSINDTAILIYTSGTTGNPKGVELTFGNLVHEIQGAIEFLQVTPDHRILSVLPFSHVLPLIANGLGPLCAGAGVIFLSSISPQRIVEAFHRHHITLFICVPQFFYVLHKRIFSQVAAQSFPLRILFRALKGIAHRSSNPAMRRRLFARIHTTIGPDLRMLASGGSRFDRRVAEDLSDLGYTMLQAYGLTETSAAATITPVDDNRLGTVGKPLPGVELHIDSPNDEGVGEVWIRGAILMKGYYREPEKTAEAMSDGWFRTGDLGFVDSGDNLTITGRSKDVIVLANGKNVYPEELEMHYSQSPFIKEICILGLTEDSDEPEGEVVHAIVVPDLDEFRRRGQTAIMEMIRFEIENLSKQVPSYYRIHSLSVRNEPFPRTVTRKLKRFEILQEESERRKTQPGPAQGEDHPRFNEKTGAVIGELVRETKPDVGALNPSMNIELDLGFDSLARVELLGLAEARLGTHIDEEQATRIFTLGELIDAFDNAAASDSVVGRSWKEILEGAGNDLPGLYIARPRPIRDPIYWLGTRLLNGLSKTAVGVTAHGLEKLPSKLPFILCPNHESFLDGPLLVSILPRRVIYNMFILGYSDYFDSPYTRWFAKICNIVAIDPNVNLVRAMQAGAVGLKHGRVLVVFPEGTRTIDGHVAEFKKGAAILAYELGIPVVPVGIRGGFEAWPRGGSFRRHPMEFHFGDPIDPRAFVQAPDPYAAMTDRLQKDVKILAADTAL